MCRAAASTASASSIRRATATWPARSFATHIGVAVCLRGDRATDAVRFSYLHFKAACHDGQVALTPAETSIAADRKAFGGEFVRGADQQDEPTPRRIGSP